MNNKIFTWTPSYIQHISIMNSECVSDFVAFMIYLSPSSKNCSPSVCWFSPKNDSLVITSAGQVFSTVAPPDTDIRIVTWFSFVGNYDEKRFHNLYFDWSLIILTQQDWRTELFDTRMGWRLCEKQNPKLKVKGWYCLLRVGILVIGLLLDHVLVQVTIIFFVVRHSFLTLTTTRWSCT